MTFTNKLNRVLALALVSLAPVIAIAQDPPAPGSGGGEPVDVPFDTNMNLIFLALGLFFAGAVVYMLRRKKASA